MAVAVYDSEEEEQPEEQQELQELAVEQQQEEQQEQLLQQQELQEEAQELQEQAEAEQQQEEQQELQQQLLLWPKHTCQCRPCLRAASGGCLPTRRGALHRSWRPPRSTRPWRALPPSPFGTPPQCPSAPFADGATAGALAARPAQRSCGQASG